MARLSQVSVFSRSTRQRSALSSGATSGGYTGNHICFALPRWDDAPTTEDVDGGGGLAQVVQVDVVIGGSHGDLVRGVWVVLHAAHIGAQLYGRGRLRLLGGPGLRDTSSTCHVISLIPAAHGIHMSCHVTDPCRPDLIASLLSCSPVPPVLKASQGGPAGAAVDYEVVLPMCRRSTAQHAVPTEMRLSLAVILRQWMSGTFVLEGDATAPSPLADRHEGASELQRQASRR